jgi:Undecaprenyl-phosphate galactose phosphotransferase WbaP
MAEAGAVLQRHAVPRQGHREWPFGEARHAERFRKLIVVASLITGDVVVAMAALTLGNAMMALGGLKLSDGNSLSIIVLVLTWVGVRLYTGFGPSPYERFRLRTIGIAVFVAINLLVRSQGDHPGRLLVAGLCEALLLLIFGHYVEALIRSLLIRLDLWGASTALIGCGECSQRLARLLVQQPALGLTPIGFIETSGDGALQKSMLPLPLIGAATDPRGIRRHIELAICGSADELSALASDPRAWMTSCRLLLVEDVHDFQSLWLRTRMLGGAIGIEIRRDLSLRHNQVLKRAIDILLALPLAVLAWPFIAVLALAVKLVDPGPAFYVQERVGRNARTLRTIKLRTMYVDAEQRLEEHLRRDPQAHAEWQRFFKLKSDPRVLPIIGAFMRRMSLDELPQLWNVIRGDMSLVGPRPFPPYHMRSFDDEFQAIRVSVPPGITGMWQVSSRSDGDLQVQKVQDLFYIRNWSIWLDVYILLQTVPAVLAARGAR